MKKSWHYIVGATALGLVVTASLVLALFVWQLKIAAKNKGSISRAFESTAFVSQKDMINAYLVGATSLHKDFKAGKVTREVYKKKALVLTVPAVFRDRHLQWILAIDAGRDGVIEDMMQEYSALTLVQ